MEPATPATDTEIAGALNYVRCHAHGLTTGNEYILRLVKRIEQEQARADEYMAEASERQREIGRLEAERDALAAQLERDCNALNCLIDDERAINQTMAAQVAALVDKYIRPMVFGCEVCDAEHTYPADDFNLPAAAAVYLAAERAMEAHGDPVMWTPALIAWRKAAGK
jgi:hypothetical protein